MALDPNYLQSLPQSLVDMYGLVEIDILTDMARRINTYDFFIPSAQHQNQKLQELGMVQGEIVVRLAALTGRTQEEIVELLTEAGEVAIEDDVEYYKASEVYEPKKVNTEALYAQLNAGLLQTQQAFFNITGTTANTATKQFERALDRAWMQINTGGMDYNTAIRRAIEGLSDAGIGAIEYPSGRIDTLETAVRRAVVTGANQTAIKTQEVLADELGSELVEVTAHGGARPEHAKWQGQVFSRNGRKTIDGVTYEDLKKATGYGKAGGLCGVNCRHSFHPYFPGTARTWSEKELDALEEKKVEYNGKKLTEYEAGQAQRGMEREIRKLKRKAAALEAAGLDASEVRRDLREANKIYSDFTKQTGIRKQPDRLKVAKGTDITGPSGNGPQNSQMGIENPGKSGKIVTGARIIDPYGDDAEEFAKSFYPEIRKRTTDTKTIARNTGKSESDIKRIKDYLFMDDSLFDEDMGIWRRFDPDGAIAQSWQRLTDGKDIKKHDRTLIEHELYEMKIKAENPGISHNEAHAIAQEKYNYRKEMREYYDNLSKSRK